MITKSAKGFPSMALASLFAEILERMTGNPTTVEKGFQQFMVYRDTGDKWELA